tara:strand:- start:5266 stop:5832 length:567 start_codon:yes stop_codon:yes gene_type:complete
MKKIILIIVGFVFVLGCDRKKTGSIDIEKKSDKEMIVVSEQATFSGTLASINFYHTILLSQTDYKCGEFGGDTVTMKIYGNKSNTKLLLDYKKTIIECAENPNPKSHERKGIEISQTEKKIIQECISELVLHKISTERIISNYGYKNRIITNDSTLIISDWPSYDWPKFKELTNIVEKITVDNNTYNK